MLLIFKDGWVMWLLFGEESKIPMSTTWVFLGLLAGREVAMNVHLRLRDWRGLLGMVGLDAGKAALGLGVSVVIAIGVPWALEAVGAVERGNTDVTPTATIPAPDP